jgi:hypothetical protein
VVSGFSECPTKAARAADLTPEQKRAMSVLKWLFRASILCVVLLGCLIVYFGEKAPTSADTGSGRVHPYFDKVHGNYVYLTELENNGVTVLLCVGVVHVFCCIVIDFKLKRSVARSQQDSDRTKSLDQNDSH